MQLDRNACYRALKTRDARFDGRFFTAVRSTGVFCRPVCPARTPRLANCEFVPSAAAARELGFRPCLRCRPEASPGTPAWDGTSALVGRAMRLIAEGELNDGSVATLADRLGVGERHLRRVFGEHVGATPIAVAQTQRVLFAKRLLDETRLPMASVALAAGFSSIRRFNDVLKSTYGRTPRELRGAGRGAVGDGLGLRLAFRTPYDWNTMLQYLERRATPGVESVAAGEYRRTIELDGARGAFQVRPVPDRAQLEVTIDIDDVAPLNRVVARVRRMFDLEADPQTIDRHLARAGLRKLVRRHPGLRVPGSIDAFELAVRAVLGQQVTVRGATTLAGRLVERFGGRLARPALGLERLFPRADELVDADLASIGMPRKRAEALRELARAVVERRVSLDGSADHDESVRQLTALPGIGPWTAEYVALRALRTPDAFPSSDLGLRQAVSEDGTPVSPKRMNEIAEPWRPWRAYAALHLWMKDVGREARR
ncbi:MAG: helix-turn-helix domain-containing protein [bacterium]|nr:helix-turn-helix domain-containing protein [bacterium]